MFESACLLHRANGSGIDCKLSRNRGIAFIEFEPKPDDEPTEKAFSLSGVVRIHANKLLIDYAPDSVVCYKYVRQIAVLLRKLLWFVLMCRTDFIEL